MIMDIKFLKYANYDIRRNSTYCSEKLFLKKMQKIMLLNAFKMAMMNFDQTLFFNTYNIYFLKKHLEKFFMKYSFH